MLSFYKGGGSARGTSLMDILRSSLCDCSRLTLYLCSAFPREKPAFPAISWLEKRRERSPPGFEAAALSIFLYPVLRERLYWEDIPTVGNSAEPNDSLKSALYSDCRMCSLTMEVRGVWVERFLNLCSSRREGILVGGGLRSGSGLLDVLGEPMFIEECNLL